MANPLSYTRTGSFIFPGSQSDLTSADPQEEVRASATLHSAPSGDLASELTREVMRRREKLEIQKHGGAAVYNEGLAFDSTMDIRV